MPSSSLFLGSCTTLISVLSLLSNTASAVAVASATKTYGYKLDKSYAGQDFFDDFTYFDQADPTHGFVTYVDKDTAVANGLASINSDGSFRMTVDSQNIYDRTDKDDYYNQNNVGRPSVRIEGKDTWTKGLWIADFAHMPASTCGTWPAYWTLADGYTWPNGGEIDIIEGVSNRHRALAALHTGSESKITGDQQTMTGELVGTDCEYYPATGSNAAGCAVLDRGTNTYGDGFNNGGRISAMEWTDEYIKVWSFAHGSAPADINSANPNPDNWPLPAQTFSGPDVNIPDNFHNHKIILDTTFCGDFAEAVWSSEGCAASTGYDTCAAFVGTNPSAFASAYWDINSIKVYQKSLPVTTTTSSTTSSRTSTSTSTPTSTSTSTSTSSESSSSVTTSSATTSSTTTLCTTTSSATTSSATTSSATTSSATTSSTTTSFTTAPSVSSSTTTFTTSGRYYGNGTTTSTSAGTTATTTYTFSVSTWTSITSSGSSSSSYTSIISSGTSSITSSASSTTPSSTNLITSSASSTTPSSTNSITSSASSTTSCSWIAPSDQTTGIPNTAITGFPQGSGVVSSQSWAYWQSASTPTFITTTITKSYVVPCSTGYETKTATFTTSYAGGAKVTYTPQIPSTTYVTTCPPEWGFGGPVTVTAPVTNSITIIVGTPKTTGVSKTSKTTSSSNGNNGDSWSNWSTSVMSSQTASTTSRTTTAKTPTATDDWNNWSNGASSTTTTLTTFTTSVSTSGWNNWSSSASSTTTVATTYTTSAATNDWSNWSTSISSTSATVKTPTATDDWNNWSSSAASTSAKVTTASATASGSNGADWSAWSGNNADVTSPVKTYTGAGAQIGVSMVLGAVAMVAALLL